MYSDRDKGQALAENHARLLSAFANPARLQLLNAMRRREVNVGELCLVCGLSQSAVSQHLNRLRGVGLVTTRRESQMIYYRLASDEAEVLLEALKELKRD